MHNGSSRRSYRSDCQTLRRPAESERPFDSRSRGRSESRSKILIRKLRKARAWRVASTPTKNARCKLLLHPPIGELTRRGDFLSWCTVRHIAGWRLMLMDLRRAHPNHSCRRRGREHCSVGGLAFGLSLGPDAEPPLERRGQNGNVTRKLAEFWETKNWPDIHVRGELIAVILNDGSGEAGFPGTTGILIADQLLLTVISITSSSGIRDKRDQRWLRVSELSS